MKDVPIRNSKQTPKIIKGFEPASSPDIFQMDEELPHHSQKSESTSALK
jgi:hypothetical protein